MIQIKCSELTSLFHFFRSLRPVSLSLSLSVCKLSPNWLFDTSCNLPCSPTSSICFSWSIFILWNAVLNTEVLTETLCADSSVLRSVYPAVLHTCSQWHAVPTKDRQSILYLVPRRYCISPSLFLVLCYRLLWIPACQNYRRMFWCVVSCRIKCTDLYCTSSSHDASGRTHRRLM